MSFQFEEPIRRHENGSINPDHYLARGLRERSLLAHDLTSRFVSASRHAVRSGASLAARTTRALLVLF